MNSPVWINGTEGEQPFARVLTEWNLLSFNTTNVTKKNNKDFQPNKRVLLDFFYDEILLFKR